MAKEVSTKQKRVYKKQQPVRLYAKGVFTGFRRSRTLQHENQALVAIQNCNDLKGARYYLGKRVAYVYKAKNTVNNTRFRCVWGKVINTHGHAGSVRVKFAKNLTARAMGSTVRVMLYPNKTI
uniref:60S ribosomal protein L35a n=1 Tax=Strombidium rassoulzadegani TaxID=1082188 RepID=A0A7S3CPW1_9SPIT